MKQIKPIIATTLRGLFLKSTPWKEAHKHWFEEAAQALKDPKIKEYAFQEGYFKYVDEVMQKRFPNLSEIERTIKAREFFFDAIIQYIEEHPEVNNQDIPPYVKTLKDKYRIALVTTNTRESLGRIISLIHLNNLFDIIETSSSEEKDDKILVFTRFLRRYGKPVLYIGGAKESTFTFCKEQGIPCVYANLEGNEEIPDVESVHDLEELKQRIGNLITPL